MTSIISWLRSVNSAQSIASFLNSQTSYTSEQQDNATNNLASNHPLGDTISEVKPDGITRFSMHNPHGLRTDFDGNSFKEYLEEAIVRQQCDGVFLSELNLDTHKTRIQQQIHSICRQVCKKYKVTYSSSDVPSVNDFKPGGTLLLTTGDITQRYGQSYSDEYGRWSAQELICKGDKNLVLISAYQVCDGQGTTTSNGRVRSLTAHVQQVRMLREKGRDVTPRRAFIQDLTRFIKQHQDKGNGILLAGDFNDDMDDAFNGMSQLCSDRELVDLMFVKHGLDDIATCVTGRRRLD